MKYKIKGIRTGLGFKQGEFAKKVGISRQYLRLIENHKAKNPSIEIMKKISKELNFPVDKLFFLDKD